ncbi:MAG TPA: OmpH family outer membrane protein [Blastocatellia bacterium]|nr:OmpH family outer membrane protein [Blastocatellia bacterium]
MKFIKLTQILFAICALAAAASAQQTATGAPAQAGAAPALLPKGKVAIINSLYFQEQIGEIKAKVESLNRQFEPRMKEIQGIRDRITALETTIDTQRKSGALAAAREAEMIEQLEQMKLDYKRRGEDLQAEGNRASEQTIAPINAKVGRFLQEYAQKRGIILLINVANESQARTVVWYDQRADVTQDFIAEYNKANPTAGAAPPAAQPQKNP